MTNKTYLENNWKSSSVDTQFVYTSLEVQLLKSTAHHAHVHCSSYLVVLSLRVWHRCVCIVFQECAFVKQVIDFVVTSYKLYSKRRDMAVLSTPFMNNTLKALVLGEHQNTDSHTTPYSWSHHCIITTTYKCGHGGGKKFSKCQVSLLGWLQDLSMWISE